MLRSIAASIANSAATTKMNTLSALNASLGTGLCESISYSLSQKVGKTYNFADFKNAVALGDVNCHSVRGGIGKDARDGEGQSGDVEEDSLHFEGVGFDEVVTEEVRGLWESLEKLRLLGAFITEEEIDCHHDVDYWHLEITWWQAVSDK